MLLSIEVSLSYRCNSPCDILLQIEAAKTKRQNILEEKIEIFPKQKAAYAKAGNKIGKRLWVKAEDKFECKYQAKVELNRSQGNLTQLQQTPLAEIQNAAIQYLLPSRYCHLEKFEGLIPPQFAEFSGGKLVISLSEWIKNAFTYAAGASDALTTAHDTYISKQGVCRDYAHVLIAMLRVSGIPARMISAYAPNVIPQDFHALVEVYLEGAWHLVDPTGMAKADEVVIIGVGRDAADISFLTAFGYLMLEMQSVEVRVITEN